MDRREWTTWKKDGYDILCVSGTALGECAIVMKKKSVKGNKEKNEKQLRIIFRFLLIPVVLGD